MIDLSLDWPLRAAARLSERPRAATGHARASRAPLLRPAAQTGGARRERVRLLRLRPADDGGFRPFRIR